MTCSNGDGGQVLALGLCRKCYQRQYKKKHPWVDKNPERKRAKSAQYYQRPEVKKKVKARARAALLKKQYGIDQEDYERMLRSQSGGCAVCAAAPGVRALHVDHDHDTGRVRGLLCGTCNQGLGMFRDSTELLRKAAAYLTK